MTEIDAVVPEIRDDVLYFLPLGGSDEIGMNSTSTGSTANG